jgi:hypothetical protein
LRRRKSTQILTQRKSSQILMQRDTQLPDLQP